MTSPFKLVASIGSDMLLADRVLHQLGHCMSEWDLVESGSAILAQYCVRCHAAAVLHVTTLCNRQDVSVLVLPEGSCNGPDLVMGDTSAYPS